MVGAVSTRLPSSDSWSGSQEELRTALVTHQYCAKFFSLATWWASLLLDSTNPVGQLPRGYCFGQRLAECSNRPTKSPSSKRHVSLLLSWCFLSSLLPCYSPWNSSVKPAVQIHALRKQYNKHEDKPSFSPKGCSWEPTVIPLHRVYKEDY